MVLAFSPVPPLIGQSSGCMQVLLVIVNILKLVKQHVCGRDPRCKEPSQSSSLGEKSSAKLTNGDSSQRLGMKRSSCLRVVGLEFGELTVDMIRRRILESLRGCVDMLHVGAFAQIGFQARHFGKTLLAKRFALPMRVP